MLALLFACKHDEVLRMVAIGLILGSVWYVSGGNRQVVVGCAACLPGGYNTLGLVSGFWVPVCAACMMQIHCY